MPAISQTGADQGPADGRLTLWGGHPVNRAIQYGTHLAAAIAAVQAVLLPYYGQARWFLAFPVATAAFAALGIVPAQAQARAAQASTPTSAGSQS